MKTSRQIKRDANHLFRLCLVNGSLDGGHVRQVVQSVLGSRRRGYLALATEFERLVRLEQMRHTARIESATPLSPEMRANVEASLIGLNGPGVSTSFAVNPALIGGMRIQVASDVYDGSLQGELAALEKSF